MLAKPAPAAVMVRAGAPRVCITVGSAQKPPVRENRPRVIGPPASGWAMVPLTVKTPPVLVTRSPSMMCHGMLYCAATEAQKPESRQHRRTIVRQVLECGSLLALWDGGLAGLRGKSGRGLPQSKTRCARPAVVSLFGLGIPDSRFFIMLHEFRVCRWWPSRSAWPGGSRFC